MDKYTVFGSDGTADVAASASAYAKALSEWKTQKEIPTDTIENAVEAAFDRFDGQRIHMPALINFALMELKAEPAQHKTLTNRVHAYVTGQSAKNTGRLDISKGVGGGVLRLSRPGEAIPARPTKKSA